VGACADDAGPPEEDASDVRPKRDDAAPTVGAPLTRKGAAPNPTNLALPEACVGACDADAAAPMPPKWGRVSAEPCACEPCNAKGTVAVTLTGAAWAPAGFSWDVSTVVKY
jgi:hypothetical protein